ncbi:MAG: hypothetical protein DWH80_08095 [Planctomycetota bacterium]|nr:MAG: hypothetical protein DWH80_08095 [Planctomycetota bacterium]
MNSLAFTCSSRLVLTLALIASVAFSANAAELVRVKRKDGTESQIFQKLITVGAVNQVHEQPNDKSKVTRIGPYNVFFHVKTDSGDVQQNGFYRVVEDPKDRNDPSKCRWIKPEDVQVWATRFAIKPTQVNKETTFQVDLPSGLKYEYVAEEVPEDATAYSFVLEGGDGAEEENGPFKVAFCEVRVDDKGISASLNQLGEMSLEICFVLEDEGFLQIDYKDDGKKFYEYVHALGESWASTIKNLSAADKVPVKLGLVIFSDSHPKSTSQKPRVVVPLTSNIGQWVAGLKSVVGQNIDGDYQNDGLSGMATALGNIGWTENSAKHVVFMGNGPFQTQQGRGRTSDLPINHYLNWLFDRTDPEGIWDGDPLKWEDAFGVNKSGKLAEGIIAEAYRMGGQKGDELRRWKHLHAIHIGQTIEQQYEPEELAGIRKFNAETDKILRPLSPSGQIDVIMEVGKNLQIDALGMSIRAWMVEAFDKYDARAQEEMRGLAQSQTYQGYYTHMNPEASEVDRVTQELGEKIKAAIQVIADVSTGKEQQAMENKTQSENELTRPIFRIIGGKLSQGDLMKPVKVGSATLRDSRSGRAVGEKVVMVSHDELFALNTALNAMYDRFNKSRKAAARQNTKEVLDKVQASLATAASGQQISADTQLQSVITDLPLRTEALKLTAGDIAVMSTSAFDAWLGDVQLAQTQIKDLLNGDPLRWIIINGLSENKTKYSFLRLSELP